MGEIIPFLVQKKSIVMKLLVSSYQTNVMFIKTGFPIGSVFTDLCL